MTSLKILPDIRYCIYTGEKLIIVCWQKYGCAPWCLTMQVVIIIIMYVEDSMMPSDFEHFLLSFDKLAYSVAIFWNFSKHLYTCILFCISAVDCHQLCIMNTISPQILMVVRMSKVKEKKGYKCKRTFA